MSMIYYVRVMHQGVTLWACICEHELDTNYKHSDWDGGALSTYYNNLSSMHVWLSSDTLCPKRRTAQTNQDKNNVLSTGERLLFAQMQKYHLNGY